MNEITTDLSFFAGVVLVGVFIALLLLSWLGAYIWEWTDDYENGSTDSPLYKLLLNKFGFFKADGYGYYKDKRYDCSDGTGPICITSAVLMFIPPILLLIYSYPFEMSIPIGLVVFAYSLRSFKRLTKKFEKHLINHAAKR